MLSYLVRLLSYLVWLDMWQNYEELFKSDSYLNFQFCFTATYGTKVVFAYLITRYLDIAMPDEKALTTDSKLNGNNSNLKRYSEAQPA